MILAACARISESFPTSVGERSDRNSRSSSNASSGSAVAAVGAVKSARPATILEAESVRSAPMRIARPQTRRP